MTTMPEEWTEFEIGDEDWDVEMDVGTAGIRRNSCTIRPPIITEDDSDDEGVSTIKVSLKPVENIEDDFAFPDDLTQLSLAPLTLSHRSSKASLEWGDHTQSSQSSEYSTLGLAEPSSSSVTESDDDFDELDGLVIPSGLFESGRKLTKMLELKKKVLIAGDRAKNDSPDPEDDFEMGIVFDDSVDLSPSRLLQQTRSKSMPARPTLLRPPSRLKTKSPNPPPSSARQFQKLALPPSPPAVPAFASKPGSLRGQKSHSGLKPPTPPGTLRKLVRKASMSSLIDTSAAGPSRPRYDAPTAASRAKTHTNSTSRIHDFQCPPTRPSTPSSNTAALRLTMPTASRTKSRPSLATVFSAPSSATRATSPLPPRPPSSSSLRSRISHNPTGSIPAPAAPKILRRPKRARTFGDGTELDAFDDLPTDREKEGRYRVQPVAFGNRVPGASYNKAATTRKANRSGGSTTSPTPPPSLKRTGTFAFPTKSVIVPEPPVRKKKNASPIQTRRKPTLIRNLTNNGSTKVVGEMKWNPHTLRWEGNDQALREFDAVVGTSTRPALITHLTGSSIGSPLGSLSSGARVVGNMIFDPAKMCWISTLAPEDDEPDVFADLADDEDDSDAWESKADTIRALASSATPTLTTSPAPSHTRTLSESGSERGSRASMVFDVDAGFSALCRVAEDRHRAEMKGWKIPQSTPEPDRSNLYEIRALATRKY